MKDKLDQYVELLFTGAARSEKNNELREELLGNLYDRYDEFLASGMSEEEAYSRTISGIGDLSELLEINRGEQTEEPREDHSYFSAPKPEKCPLYSEEETEKKKRLYPILHAIAVVLYILCPVPSMIFDSDISSALLFLFAAIATAIFIYTAHTKPVLVIYSLSEKERTALIRNRHGAGIMRGVGVALYITCVCPTILLVNTAGIILMFLMIALATAIMILTSSLFPTEAECEPQFEKTEKNKSRKEKEIPSPYNVFCKVVSAIFWIVVIAVYLILSFTTCRWWVTWLIFPIAGFMSGIISGIFNLVSSRKIAGSIVKISICSVFLFAFISLFTLAMSSVGTDLGFITMLSADNSFYAEADDLNYKYGRTEYPADEINEIDVSWVAGKVIIEAWNEDHVLVNESGCESDDYVDWVHSKLEGGRLTVKFSEPKSGFDRFTFEEKESKTLTVKLPSSMISDSVLINSISSDIELRSLSGLDMDISNVSGDISLKDCFYRDVDLESVSGSLTLSGGCRTLELSMVSGMVSLSLESAPEEVSIETVSGNVDITFPEDISGFTLVSDSLSDKVSISHPVEQKGERYVFGDGSTRVDIDSVSGKITVK